MIQVNLFIRENRHTDLREQTYGCQEEQCREGIVREFGIDVCVWTLKSLKSCPTLCDPMDWSPLGSSVHGILQARILEWVAISSSRGSSRPRDRTHISLHLLHWQAGPLLLANLGSPWDGCIHSAAFKLGNQQGPTVLAQGTLLNVMWQPGWEGDLEENGYMYLYAWVPLLSTWNYDIVNWLYSKIKSSFETPNSLPHSANFLAHIRHTQSIHYVPDTVLRTVFFISFNLHNALWNRYFRWPLNNLGLNCMGSN